jgi:hypothetical protein
VDHNIDVMHHNQPWIIFIFIIARAACHSTSILTAPQWAFVFLGGVSRKDSDPSALAEWLSTVP